MTSAIQSLRCLLLLALLTLGVGCKPGEDPMAEEPLAPAPKASEPADPTTSPPEEEPVEPEVEAEPEPEPINTHSKAAILGYHRFSETANISKRLLPTTIHIEKFRAQMQTLVDNDIPVISLGDFLAWRRGEKNIPPFSVIITIDDGWKSTYTLALPVLREFGFPFTIYLYTDFLNGGGKTLTYDQIYEMVDAGAEIGSHSVSHQDLRRQGRRSDEMQTADLKEQVGGSRRILNERLGIDPVTFSYPYGTYNDKVVAAAEEAEYEAMVTVAGRQVGWETDLRKLGRYIVHGEDDRPFDWALASRMPRGVASANNILKETTTDESTGEKKPLVEVTPAAESKVSVGRPIIEANLSQIEGLDPESLKMMIGGLGEVNARFDQEAKTFSYQPVQRLRRPNYWVQVRFKREGKKKEDVMRWKFSTDAVPRYLEDIPELADEDSLTTDDASVEEEELGNDAANASTASQQP